MDKIYKQYAIINAEIRELEAKKESLKGDLIESLKDEPEGKVETDFGNFTLGSRQVWKYSDAIKSKEESLKIAKDKEQKKGIAKATTTEYVVFTIPKE